MLRKEKRNEYIGDCVMKTYNCPSCGARIALGDINVKADVMLCRACGRTSSCSKYLQREAFGKAPGKPPKRVRVIHNEMTFDRPREERIELRRVKSSGAFWCASAIALLLMLCSFDFNKPKEVIYVLAFVGYVLWLLAKTLKENKRDRARPHYRVRITSSGMRPGATVRVDYEFEGDSAPKSLAVYVLQRDAMLGRLPKKRDEENTPEREDCVFATDSLGELHYGHFSFTIPDAIESERINWELAFAYSSSSDVNENVVGDYFTLVL